MLTANQTNIQTAIRVEHSHMGIQVFLGEGDSQLMGTIETYPAWGLDILPEGVQDTDDVFVALNAPYKLLEQAVAAVTANWLVEGSSMLPDYF
jgi:hypothetical protein